MATGTKMPFFLNTVPFFALILAYPYCLTNDCPKINLDPHILSDTSQIPVSYILFWLTSFPCRLDIHQLCAYTVYIQHRNPSLRPRMQVFFNHLLILDQNIFHIILNFHSNMNIILLLLFFVSKIVVSDSVHITCSTLWALSKLMFLQRGEKST